LRLCPPTHEDIPHTVYSDPDPVYSEPDHYENHEDTPEGYEYEYEGEVGGYELRELERDEDGRDEHREREYERKHEEARYEPKGLKYEGDEGYKHEEFMHEPKHDAEANYMERNAETGYTEREPTGFDCNVEQTGEYTPHPFPPFPNPPPTPRARDAPRSNQQGNVTASEHHAYAFNDDDGHKPQGFECDVVYEHVGSVYHNARTANGTSPHPQLIYHEESGEYVNPCFLTPAQIAHHHNTLEHPLTPHPIPISPSPFTSTPPLPQPTPPTFVTSPPPNEQGHMSTFTDVNDDAGEHLTDYPPPTYTDLDALRRDYDNGVPDAITYMQGLQAYSDECLREIMEEERQEEVRYTLEHPPSPPPNPTAISDNKPDYIEVSRPLFAQPKRQHRKKYPERRPLPTPTHHLNNNSTPYPTS
jgi:hypothetical protein